MSPVRAPPWSSYSEWRSTITPPPRERCGLSGPCVDGSQDPELEEQATEQFEELEHKTTELFAARARVDDLRIRSFVDYLEEMSRQFVAALNN